MTVTPIRVPVASVQGTLALDAGEATWVRRLD